VDQAEDQREHAERDAVRDEPGAHRMTRLHVRQPAGLVGAERLRIQVLLGLELRDDVLRAQKQHEPRVVIHLDVLREEALECEHHVLRRAPAIARLFLEALVDDSLELARNLGIHFARALVLLESNLVHRRTLLVLDEGLLAGEHLVQHDTERKDVAAGVELVAEHLLGRHVRGGADTGACLGEITE
jgi:hypothetical protein